MQVYQWYSLIKKGEH